MLARSLRTLPTAQAPVEAFARSLQIATAYQGHCEQSATFRKPIGLLPVACKETAVIGPLSLLAFRHLVQLFRIRVI